MGSKEEELFKEVIELMLRHVAAAPKGEVEGALIAAMAAGMASVESLHEFAHATCPSCPMPHAASRAMVLSKSAAVLVLKGLPTDRKEVQ